MNTSKTMTIQITVDDWELLETEASRNNLPPDILISQIIQERLTRIKQQITPLEALLRLREIGQRQVSTDAVKLAKESREDLKLRDIL